MKNIFKWSFFAFLSAFVLIGCSSDAADVLSGDEIDLTDKVDEFGNPVDTNGNSIASVWQTEGDEANAKLYTKIAGEANGFATALVNFTTTQSKQKRLYVTQTLPGGSPLPFEIPELTNKATKADGSIDLDGETKNSFEFAFDLDVPGSVDDGSIIYNFWTTETVGLSNKGDYRDSTVRKLLGVATIEVVVGTGTVDTPVRTFGGLTLQLDAPTQDGLSDTFMSVYNGEIYQLNQGEELAAFWDFGYYWIASVGGPSLASTSNYYELFTDGAGGFDGIADKFGIAQSELNNFYIAKSTSGLDFDAVTLSSDLDAISTPITQAVNGLKELDVLEFEDQYGTKGLIKIIDINGTDGNDAYITFDIKVQAYSAIDTSNL